MSRSKNENVNDDLRRIVHAHLRKSSHASRASTGAHLDEDALSVFVEGRLSELEAAPIMKHLVGCGSCRRITAALIRLDTELGDTPLEQPIANEEPGRIRRLLAGLAARVLPSSGDDVVFAYHAPADDFEKKDEAEGKEKTEDADKDRGRSEY